MTLTFEIRTGLRIFCQNFFIKKKHYKWKLTLFAVTCWLRWNSLAALLKSRTETIWHSRKGEANHRGGNCQLEGHSPKTQDTLPFALLITHILYEYYPGVLSSDLPSDRQKILQTPTNRPVHGLLNKNRFEILMSGILSYGKQLLSHIWKD